MTLEPPVYLDHNGTTPVDPRVLGAMVRWLGPSVGNASASNDHGLRARACFESSAAEVAAAAGGGDVVFTSGATESVNLALKGAVDRWRSRHGAWPSVVVTAVEHPAVMVACGHLMRRGCRVAVVPVDARGVVDPAAVAAAAGRDAAVVAVMAANNEVGSVQPVAEVCELVRRGDGRRRSPCLVLSDASQAFGRLDVSHADLVAVSAHKVYGPQGVGALVVRGPAVGSLEAQIHGGGQQAGLRAGTPPVALAAGLSEASRLMLLEGGAEADRVACLRDSLAEAILSALDGVVVNGPWGGPRHRDDRLDGNLSLSFRGVCGSLLDDATRHHVSASSGSACSSATRRPSPVIEAIGGMRPDQGATVRFGVGRFTTADEVAFAAEVFVSAVRRIRGQRAAR